MAIETVTILDSPNSGRVKWNANDGELDTRILETETDIADLENRVTTVENEGGVPGEQGEPGEPGEPGRGFNPRGEWADALDYVADDMVQYLGSTYRVTTDHTSDDLAPPMTDNSNPNYEAWALKGSTGSGGGGEGGAVGIYRANTEVVAAAAVVDFSTAFLVSESPTDEANVSPNFGTAAGTITQGNDSRFTFISETAPTLPPEGSAWYKPTADATYVNIGTPGVPIWKQMDAPLTAPPFSRAGTPLVGPIPFRWRVPRPITIVGYEFTINTPITGGALTVDLDRATSGIPATMESLYATTANRPSTTSTTAYHAVAAAPPDTVDIPAGDFLQARITGTPTGGSDIAIFLHYFVRS
jgi:hypothetical protein